MISILRKIVTDAHRVHAYDSANRMEFGPVMRDRGTKRQRRIVALARAGLFSVKLCDLEIKNIEHGRKKERNT